MTDAPGTAPSFRAFFGDSTRTFRLTPELIEELERKLNAGIGGIAKRLFSSDFRHAEITETIRLALIGGGESPKVAASLTAAYAANRPIVETLPLAIAVLETAWFGKPQADEAPENPPKNTNFADLEGGQ